MDLLQHKSSKSVEFFDNSATFHDFWRRKCKFEPRSPQLPKQDKNNNHFCPRESPNAADLFKNSTDLERICYSKSIAVEFSSKSYVVWKMERVEVGSSWIFFENFPSHFDLAPFIKSLKKLNETFFFQKTPRFGFSNTRAVDCR